MPVELILSRKTATSNGGFGHRRVKIIPALVLALVCAGSASMLYYEFALFVPHMRESLASGGLGRGQLFGNDFYQIWLTTRESWNGNRDLYGRDMTGKIQAGLFGRPLDERNRTDPPIGYRRYVYPAFTNLLLWPSALLEFASLGIVLTLLFPLLAATSLWMWLKALDWSIGAIWLAVLIIFTLGTHQLLEAFYALQPGLFVGFCLSAAAFAIRTKRLMLAGLLCALSLIKPQVTALAVAYLLLWSWSDRTRARFWQAFLGMGLTLLLLSSLTWPHWISGWIAVLSGYHLHAPPTLVQVLLGPRVPEFVSTMIITILIAASVWVAWVNRNAAADTYKFWFTLSFVLAMTAVTLFHEQAIYDQIILIPGILLLLRDRSKLRIPLILWYVAAILLIWPFIAAFLLMVVRPVLSPAVLYAPVVSEVALPFAVLALLGWAWRSNAILQKKIQVAATQNS